MKFYSTKEVITRDIKMAFSRTATDQYNNILVASTQIKDNRLGKKKKRTSEFASAYVGVCGRLELLDSTMRSNVFDAVAKGNFIQ